MMFRTYLSVLSLLLLSTVLSAQFSVTGQVLIGNADGPPVPEWAVEIFSSSPDEPILTVITNEEGIYLTELDQGLITGDVWYARTLDVCTGVFQETEFELDPAQLSYQIDFVICNGIDPPPPPECEAHFYYEQIPNDEGFAVQFFDLSYPGEGGVISWSWDFGDDNSSAEQNPTHIYAEEGEYLVTLTISGEDCAATFIDIVTVYDEGNCDCPTDEYDPVCVITPSGFFMEFVSPCYAECAGFGPDSHIDCEGNECGCPEFYAPVCVTDAGGNIITFDNHCFAECEGYGPDQWMECENECECPADVYDPVCVWTPFGGIIEFQNSCYAECDGFEPGQYQDCDQGCVCPDYYDPICVTLDDGTVLTFDNLCFAQCEGYGPEQWEACDDDCVCPDTVYDPVCVATPSGLILTFINACEAECAGYGPDVYYSCDGNECGCPEYYDPVCVTNAGGDIITFSNPCFAECEGYGPDQYIECDTECDCEGTAGPEVCVNTPFGVITFPTACYAECAGYDSDTWLDECPQDCICDDIWDPVCVALDDGSIITFGNACEAECFGFGEDDFVECEGGCVCPEIYSPVCVTDPVTGTTLEFINSCYAECEGYGPDQYEDCSDTCECPLVWEPVCVSGIAGLITFPNACFAECEGFGPEDFVDCDISCGCPTIYEPVCVTTATGEVITFTNACVAECEGFTPDQYGECEDCICDDFYFPVCVIDPATGDFIEFLNPCEAVCAGYSEEDVFPCDNNDDCYANYTYEFSDDTGGGHTVIFTDQSFAIDGITSWMWDFGDGNTSTEQNPTHTYTEAGVYDVTLTVESPECGSLSVIYHLCVGDGGGVGGPECQAFFFFEQPDADNLLQYQFIDFSLVGNATAWIWDFGDGTTATEQNPTHTYAEAGFYNVTLTILSEDCESSIQIGLTAGENVWYGDLECRAWFLPIINTATLEVYFINLSSPDAVVFNWDFGDGNTSEDPLPLHTYAEPGTYTVSLTTTSADGCTNTFSTTITFGEDDGGFTSNPTFSLVSSTEELTTLTKLTAYPNPTKDQVQVRWETITAGDYNWQLYNLNGKLLQTNSTRAIGGDTTLTLDMNSLPAGIYLFRLQTPDGQQTLRLSKL